MSEQFTYDQIEAEVLQNTSRAGYYAEKIDAGEVALNDEELVQFEALLVRVTIESSALLLMDQS